MLSDNEDQDKCRERRRRRIEMRRLAVISVASSPPKPSNQNQRENTSRTECSADSKRIRMTEKLDLPEPSYSSSGDEVEASPAPESEVPPVSEPVFGSMSVSGRSRDMEDTISVRTSLCRSEISTRRPVHFFAVFDGHGGPHVAALCRERMHEFVKEELTRLSRAGETGIGSGSSSRNGHEERQGLLEERWRTALRKSFERMDEVALSTCTCGRVGYKCRCHPMEVALGGSTAVVALLSPERIVVANCGDSRAVLCRAGTAIPLSQDHKPDRSDELARIEAAGGRVIFVNGARVEGILAMSRAIDENKYISWRGDIQRATDISKEVEESTAILGQVQRCCMPFIRVASAVFHKPNVP
ncbi:probable protein phosphatase 2C 75 isoform X2 [Juglans microcarpa x Juglans regia]|uniref:probable protein phosphatase 2C 75 isoform X2 n=1 Tax=Juglans microcarpa x Juglans regia TaxID=2249226 RepID=UPI001B7EC558|nr:probable protein phosphatase 2C 75 isoform X2 [Juglans microcarpa x Juglans regia]